MEHTAIPRHPQYAGPPPPPPHNGLIPLQVQRQLNPVLIVDQSGRPIRPATAGGIFWAVLGALMVWTVVMWIILSALVDNVSSNGF